MIDSGVPPSEATKSVDDSRAMKQLVASVGDALHAGRGAYFVGSGISAKSGLPSWLGLLQPLADPLGLTLTRDDDLPLVAQYCVNEDLGNRAALIRNLHKVLRPTMLTNAYHAAIAQTDVRVLWTTNYDTLLEDALTAQMHVAVRVHDTDLAHGPPLGGAVEVLKPHGCLRRSSRPDCCHARSLMASRAA